MNERVAQILERNFGAGSVTRSRVRFDGPEVPMLAPVDVQGFQQALSLARTEGWKVLPSGLGSKLSWCSPAQRVDFLLSTWAHSGVVAYESGDGTISARAGTTMAELSAQASAGGHALTPDVPRPRRATLGGVIASAQSGADRLRYGPVRDHVLGIEVILADGTAAKSGGRLVKNVTGYDLQRLYTGSHGSLCLIVEATLRLFPLPEDECLVQIIAADRAQMLQIVSKALAGPLRPVSLLAGRVDPPQPGAQWLVTLHLGGRREALAAERAVSAQLWPDASVLNGTQARAEAELLRERNFDEPDGPLLRVFLRPAAFALGLELLEGLLAPEIGEGALQPRWLTEPGVARIDVALRPRQGESQRLARLVETARAALAPLHAGVQLLHAAHDAGVGAFGPIGAGAQLMSDLRDRLDPTGVFACGRFGERNGHGTR